jgi:hypothetical protein
MTVVPRWSLSLVVLLLLLTLTGCGDTPPDTEPIPVYPGVSQISSGDNFVASLLQGMAQEMVADTAFQGIPQFYTLPEGATFADVAAFYDAELSAREWTPYDEMLHLDRGGVAGWQHGSSQVFVLRVLPDEANSLTVLMTLEARRQE